MARELVQLQPGKPELIALKYSKGTAYEHRVMFTTTDNRILYLANDDASRLEQLGIEKETQFFITLVGMTGKHPRYEFRSLTAPEVMAFSPEPLDNKSEYIGTLQTLAPPIEWPPDETCHAESVAKAPELTQSARMMACFMSAIDAVAEAQVYATRKGLGITFSSGNVTSTALSCYINECRGGRA
jgi:hypothetical protein